ncbi:imidazolonepropionase [Maribacter sp. 2307ULW6-5]|uniref:imidazolonepropionase n=1 Tax=Maribacter sp. 2307ULW6-5 TaxID=3386275 RepID=UPI0039BD50A4
MAHLKLLGPFTQLLPMNGLPKKGALHDAQLPVLQNAGIVIQGAHIKDMGPFNALKEKYPQAHLDFLEGPHTGLPGLVDPHTHICFGGSRAKDYALRNAGKSYLDIAKAGGGIWDTVTQTRMAPEAALVKSTCSLAKRHLRNGTTTLEVKSGYGLSVREELKMLRAIQSANQQLPMDLVPTCLAAHMHPKDHKGSPADYLEEMSRELLPLVKKEHLAQRVDAFIEESAFSPAQIAPYFKKAKELGFALTVHADQFTAGGSQVAVELGALSADHLEASGPREIDLLAQSNTVAMALPGASLGLGCAFAPARKLLDAGACLAIGSDHNPGSAPMGDLLTQAAVLGAFEKLTNAEVLAGITVRAAAALNLTDRGQLGQGMLADLILFHTADHRDILYHQGNLKPCVVYKRGERVYDKHRQKNH